MKKITTILAVAAIALVTTQANAQIRFGARAGLNLANMNVTPSMTPSPTMKISFHIGGVAEYNLADAFALEAGLLISGKGAELENTVTVLTTTVTSKASVSPMYVEVPINAVYKIKTDAMQIHLFAGPYLGFGVAGSIKVTTTATNLPAGVTLPADKNDAIKFGSSATDDFAATDFGLNVGAGVEISNFQVRAQYGLGLSDINPVSVSGASTKNNVIALSLGYMFGDSK